MPAARNRTAVESDWKTRVAGLINKPEAKAALRVRPVALTFELDATITGALDRRGRTGFQWGTNCGI